MRAADLPLDDGRFRRVFAAEAASLLDWESAVQRAVPRDALSRVISYELLGSFALGPVGLAVGGLLAEPLGATTAMLGAGVLLVLLPGLLWANPGIRALRA